MTTTVTDVPEAADGESAGILSAADSPSLFPEAPAGSNWFVLHTRSRQEKAVADALRALNTWCFLPLLNHTRVYRGRKIQVQLPLIPSYVFMKGQPEEAYQLDRNNRLANIIPVTNQARLEWELGNIRRAIDAHIALDPYPYLRKGIRAEVRSGPLRGTQGIIEDRTKLTRLILQVDMLGRAVSLELDGALLEPLE